MMRLKPLFLALAAASAALAPGCSQKPANTDPAALALIERVGHTELQRSPEQAEALGVSAKIFGGDYSGLLDDRSIAAVEKNRLARVVALNDLQALDHSTLTRPTQRQLDTAVHVLDAAVRVDRYGFGYVNLGWASPYLINQSDGAYTDLVKVLTLRRSVHNRADAQAWLKKLEAAPQAIRDEQRRFEIDIENGAMPPRNVLQRTLEKVRALTPNNPRDNTLIQTFTEQLSQIQDIKDEEIRTSVDEAAKTIETKLAPAYRALEKTIETALKTASDDPGVWRLKNGDAYYRDMLHLYTSTDLTPKEVHDLGLKLVADISKQMEPLLDGIEPSESSVAERLAALAKDPMFLYPDTDEGRTALAAALQTQIDWGNQHMARIASAVPSRAVEIRQAPAVVRDTAPGAYYRPASLDGTRPATYNLNLKTTLDWPMWSLPTLTYHETVPGHHVQAGLAREKWNGQVLGLLTSWPAFSEGWGTYAEDLADELGAYKDDPRAKLGYLQSLLFRAARLVTDTGIHSEKWTRQQAVDYLVHTTGLPRAEMENEVDRYTIWPGQACAYMIGRLTIRRLRDSADKELGQAFDLKAFHNAVLAGGGRPLPILEADIHDWVISRKPAPAPK